MELSQESEPTSPDSKRFGKEEMDYLQWIALSLQNPPMPGAVRVYLEKAQMEGLDPRRIYEAAVESRPDHWMKAPTWDEVNPERSPQPQPENA